MRLNQRNYVLETRIDEATGETGLSFAQVKSMPDYPSVANTGFLLAHDLIEHQQLERIGSVWDELKALSCVWLVRGQHGEIVRGGRSPYTPQENIASDFVNLALIMYHGARGYSDKEAKEFRTPRRNRDELACMDTFSDMMDIAVKGFRDEIDAESDREVAAATLWFRNTFTPVARRAWILGARQLYKTWGQAVDNFRLNTLFWELSAHFEFMIEMADYEGQRFLLTLHKDGDCRTDLRPTTEELY